MPKTENSDHVSVCYCNIYIIYLIVITVSFEQNLQIFFYLLQDGMIDSFCFVDSLVHYLIDSLATWLIRK